MINKLVRKKRLICVILPVWLAGLWPVFAQPVVLLGDVNRDGQVTIVDALMIAQYYVGLNPPGFEPAGADVTVNGTIDIIDALSVAKYCVGLIDSLPPGGGPPPVATPTPVATGTPLSTSTPQADGFRWDNPLLDASCYVDEQWSALATAGGGAAIAGVLCAGNYSLLPVDGPL